LSERFGQFRPPVTKARKRVGVVKSAERDTAGGGYVRHRQGLIVVPASQTGECQTCLEGGLAGKVAGSGGQSDR